MLLVPLSAAPSQTLSAVLAGQNCQINVYQKTTGVYLDLAVNSSPVCNTVLCAVGMPLVMNAYLGFVGNLMFIDTQGSDSPQYTGFGARWQLVYLELTDL